VVDRDGGAVCRQLEGDRLPDPRIGTGHERAASVEQPRGLRV